MTQTQPNEKRIPPLITDSAKSFTNFWIGAFFFLSSVSLLILMMMFIFVWQPIWSEGFKDFHTISNAIDKLDKTAKPASEAIPLILAEMNQINKHMYQMNTTMYEINRMSKTMHDMNASLASIEQMTPEIKRMTVSIDQMTMVLSTEIPRMSYTMDRVKNKMPSMNFMP